MLQQGAVRSAGVAAESAHSALRPLKRGRTVLVEAVNETKVQPSIALPTAMKKPTPEPAASEINAKTEELIKEFFAHVRKVRKQHPGVADARVIFEAWAIQKIAALQYTVLHLADAIAELQGGLCGTGKRKKNG